MSKNLLHLAWPAEQLHLALETLVERRGFATHATAAVTPPPPQAIGDDELLTAWLTASCTHLGVEAEPVLAAYSNTEALVRGAAPALLRVPDGDDGRFWVLLRHKRDQITLLTPTQTTVRVAATVLVAALRQPLEAPVSAEIDKLLAEAEVPQGRRAKARQAILHERLGTKPIRGCWLVRLPPATLVAAHLHHSGLNRTIAHFVGAYVVQYLFWLLAWWMIGRAALQGQLQQDWLLAWALILITLVPFRLIATWTQGFFAVRAGGWLKTRLLVGALRLPPDAVRHLGIGQFLGRIAESEMVETLALSGGFLALVALIELLVALAVLAAGAGGRYHLLGLLAWFLLTLLMGWRFYQQRTGWTTTRLTMTHDLIERMVGHRTRLAQEAPNRWHIGEDQALAGYWAQSHRMDRVAVWLQALVPRGWLAVGLLGIAPAFVAGEASTPHLAVALGGILLARQAFKRLTQGIVHLSGAALAWHEVAPLFHAAAATEDVSAAVPLSVTAPHETAADATPATLLQAHELSYRYRTHGAPVLQNCSLRIQQGERLLLEGASGGGKSTLAALLTGLRQPESGLLLLGGLDRQTLGAGGWRKKIAAAPQFHENHVFTETFAFNLLMGRRWPPEGKDMAEALEICNELGLGPLLERMPAGMLQMVGETGWQLSHGERSRLYLARALLQGAELIILDESFAALDPENLERALQSVLKRAPALLVIAHP